MADHTNVSGDVFEQFLATDASGRIDKRVTLQNFQRGLDAYLKMSDEIKPVILQELKTYKRLGESVLIPYAAHRLGVPMSAEVVTRIQRAIKSLVDEGAIVFKTTEKGGTRGRGVGYQLVEESTQ